MGIQLPKMTKNVLLNLLLGLLLVLLLLRRLLLLDSVLVPVQVQLQSKVLLRLAVEVALVVVLLLLGLLLLVPGHPLLGFPVLVNSQLVLLQELVLALPLLGLPLALLHWLHQTPHCHRRSVDHCRLPGHCCRRLAGLGRLLGQAGHQGHGAPLVGLRSR